MSKKKFKTTSFNMNNKPYRRQILLSISIMVSGREETTEKCIVSLDKLRKRVPCELILTDTGCSAEMHEWLRQKADKVLKFAWCNDFAAARNVGLRAARGLWFMFLDDDEWFEDTTGIENFFLTGDYRRYESASYIVRNYANMEGTVWRDTALRRMAKRYPNTRFFYPVHETLWPVIDPSKKIGDYAHHYGYASADPEVQMAKRRRNLSILLPEIEKDPQCMHHYLQGVAEYLAVDDYRAACELADRGIANCDSAREDNGVFLQGLYASAVRMRVRLGQYQEAVRKGSEYLGKAALSDLARASIYSDMAVACGELGEAETSLNSLQEYLGWKDYFEKNRDIWAIQTTLVLDSCFENYQYRKVMGWGFSAALALGNAESAEALLAREPLDWWLHTVQDWYTLTSQRSKEKWQWDFGQLANRVDQTCPHICQFYAMLTQGAPFSEEGVPEAQEQREESTPVKQETVESTAVTKEMEVLAEQLKEKIRLLIRQGQLPAAQAVIIQLQGYFPEDEELDALWQSCK